MSGFAQRFSVSNIVHVRKPWGSAVGVGLLSVLLFLSGCGGGGTESTSAAPPVTSNPPPVSPPAVTPPPPPQPPPPAPAPTTSVHGVVSGALKAVKGASVTLYRVGLTGYGSSAAVLGAATTDSSGAWTVTFTPPADDPLVYVATNGGDTGLGANNAIALLAALGPLSRIPSTVTVNEVTTAASIYSLAQFLDPVAATSVGAPASNSLGLMNAFGTVPNLVDVTSGTAIASPDVLTPVLNPLTQAHEAPPQRFLNTLAEIISACIGSRGPASAGCATLLTLATPPGGSAPADTRQAMLDIALHPAHNVAELFTLSSTGGAKFAPDLGGVPPNDWTMAINFTGGALVGAGGALGGSVPMGIAIDAAGNVWVTSQRCSLLNTTLLGCVLELSPQGVQAGPYPSASSGISLDLNLAGGAITISTSPVSGKEIVWVTSDFPSSLYALDARDGSVLFGGAITAAGQLRRPDAIASDALGNVWVINRLPRILADGSTIASLIELSPGPGDNYSAIQVFNYSTPAGVIPPSFADLALDGDSPANIWVSDAVANQIVEFKGVSPGVQSTTRAFALAGTSSPGPMAVDLNGNLWAADFSGGVSELVKGAAGFTERDIAGSTISNPGEPDGIAVDGAGHLWVSNVDNSANKGVVELDPTGVSLTAATAIGAYNGGSPVTGGPLGPPNVGTSPQGAAIDASGNVWVAAGGMGGVVELVGAAVPVKTPRHGPPSRP